MVENIAPYGARCIWKDALGTRSCIVTLGKISKRRSEARANNGEIAVDASQTRFGSEKAGCQTEYN